MGVRGLTTFVENDKVLSEVYRLHDCKLVIDGHSLMFWLAGKSLHPDSRVNQEYANYGVTVRRFFNGLHQCGVEPLVVFDGPATEEKYDKVLRTLEGNVAAIEGMFHSDDEELIAKRLLPPFSLDAIMQLMVDMEIPFASSLADADSEVVALANFLGCPLLAEDSDYCIFEVEYGYIRLRGFPDSAEEGETELHCKRFLSQTFCCKYSVPQNKLPFLSILLGNDWVLTEVFSEKVFGIAKSFGVDRRDFTWRVKAAILWLSQRAIKSDGEILEELKRSLPSPDKDENITKIEYSVSLYRDLPDISKLHKILCPEPAPKKDPECSIEKPVGVEDAIRWCYVHFSAYHLVRFNFVELPSSIVCDTHKHSPHFCSVEIRNFVYRYLLRRFCLAEEGPQVLLVEEYDYDGESYKKVRGVNIYTSICPFCEERHKFEDQCKTASGETQEVKIGSVLSKFLSVDFQHSFQEFWTKEGKELLSDLKPSLHQRLDVVMLATFYWFKKTTPGRRSVAALLLTLAVIPSLSFKGKKISLKSILTKRNISNKESSNNGDNVPKNEESSSMSGGDGENSKASSQSVEKSISLRPAWYHKKLATQETKKALDFYEKARHDPPPDVSKIKTDGRPKSVCEYVNLFGPLAPVASRSGRMYWWTLQDDFETDMELLHSIAEWQCCLWAVLLLHQAMEYNGLHLGLYDIFGSNLTLHEIHARLSRSEAGCEHNHEDLRSYLDHVAKCLDTAPATKDNYEMMVEYLLQ